MRSAASSIRRRVRHRLAGACAPSAWGTATLWAGRGGPVHPGRRRAASACDMACLHVAVTRLRRRGLGRSKMNKAGQSEASISGWSTPRPPPHFPDPLKHALRPADAIVGPEQKHRSGALSVRPPSGLLGSSVAGAHGLRIRRVQSLRTAFRQGDKLRCKAGHPIRMASLYLASVTANDFIFACIR